MSDLEDLRRLFPAGGSSRPFEAAALHSEMLSPYQQVVGQSAHSLAANALIEEHGLSPNAAQNAVDTVLDAIRDADLRKKKVVGCGKHGFGEKREEQFKDDVLRIKQGRGR